MSNNSAYRLSDLFELQMGKTPSRKEPTYWSDGTYPWAAIGDMNGKYISNTTELINDKAVRETKIKLIPKNTVIMSFKLSLGKVSITKNPLYSNEAIMAFIDKGVIQLDTDYVYYLLSAQNWTEKFNKAAKGKTLNKAILSNYIVYIHEIEEQKVICKVLNAVDTLLDNAKQQLEAFEELKKSLFIEMFGDPVINEKKWPSKTVSEFCTSIYGGGTPSKSHPEYFSGTIPWVSPKDMKSKIINDSIDHITEEAIENSSTSEVPENSILMVIRSGILKRELPVAINRVIVTINQDMKAFVPGNLVTPEYLLYMFVLSESSILSKVRSVTADNIDFKDFQKRKFPIPPKSIQDTFSSRIKQIDKSKFIVEKALKEVEELKNELLQRYFSPELYS